MISKFIAFFKRRHIEKKSAVTDRNETVKKSCVILSSVWN